MHAFRRPLFRRRFMGLREGRLFAPGQCLSVSNTAAPGR